MEEEKTNDTDDEGADEGVEKEQLDQDTNEDADDFLETPEGEKVIEEVKKEEEVPETIEEKPSEEELTESEALAKRKSEITPIIEETKTALQELKDSPVGSDRREIAEDRLVELYLK